MSLIFSKAKNKKKTAAAAESSDNEDDAKSVVSNVSSNPSQPVKAKGKKGECGLPLSTCRKLKLENYTDYFLTKPILPIEL